MSAILHSRSSHWCLLVVILIGACALRFYRIDSQELRGDEGASWVRFSQEAGPVQLMERLISEGQPHPPVHYWLLQGWERVFGDSEFALRSQSALLSLLVIVLAYRLALRVTSDSFTPLAVAVITALQPYQIWLAQDVKNMYQLALAAVLLCTLQLPDLLRGKKRAWLIYVLSGAFGMLSHYYAIFGLVAHGFYVLWVRADRRAWLRWIAAGFAIALAILPWVIAVLPGLVTRQLNRPGGAPLLNFLSDTLGDAALGPSIPDLPATLGALIGGVIVVVGAVALWRSRRAWAGLLAGWLLLALVITYLVTRFRSTYNTFYFSNTFPVIYVLFALGMNQIRTRRRVAFGLVAGLTLIGFATGLSNYYFDPRWSKSRGIRDMAREIMAEGRPGDIIIGNYPDPAMIYYLRHTALPYVTLPEQHNFDPAEVGQTITDLAAQYDRLWHIPVRSAGWDASGFVEGYLADHFVAAVDYRFDKTRLRLFAVRPEHLPDYHALDIHFGGGITLMGSYVTVNGDPTAMAANPGDWLRASLLWTTSQLIPTDYKVFVHATGADGSIVAQHDSPPHNGSAPTSQWQPGTTVLDVHEFQLPTDSSPASIVVRVGMYDPNTLQRLATSSGSDAITIWAGTDR